MSQHSRTAYTWWKGCCGFTRSLGDMHRQLVQCSFVLLFS